MSIKLTESRLRQIIREEISKESGKEIAAEIKDNPAVLVNSEDEFLKAIKQNPKLVDQILRAGAAAGLTPQKAQSLASKAEQTAHATNEADSAAGLASASLPATAFATMFAWSGGDPKYLAAAIGSLALGWLVDKLVNSQDVKDADENAKRLEAMYGGKWKRNDSGDGYTRIGEGTLTRRLR